MTDRHAGYVIVLEKDIREDDAERLVSALGMMKGVLTVKPIIADATLHIAEERARTAVAGAAMAALQEVWYGRTSTDGA